MPSLAEIYATYEGAEYVRASSSPKRFEDERKGNCIAAARSILHHVNPEDRLMIVRDDGLFPHFMAAEVSAGKNEINTFGIGWGGMQRLQRQCQVKLGQEATCGSVLTHASYDPESLQYNLEGRGAGVILLRTPQIEDFFRALFDRGLSEIHPWGGIAQTASEFVDANTQAI